MTVKRIYWDTSCFISMLSADHTQERERAHICKDILKHAQNDAIQIWTSVYTIVETLRPKEEYKPSPLPDWSKALDVRDEAGLPLYPKALAEAQTIWDHWKRHTLPTRKLSPEQSETIRRMFQWPFIRKIQIVPSIAERAAEIARDHNMKPADSLHVASALARKCDQLQRWDRDYRRTDSLIQSVEPARMTSQADLDLGSGTSNDFKLD